MKKLFAILAVSLSLGGCEMSVPTDDIPMLMYKLNKCKDVSMSARLLEGPNGEIRVNCTEQGVK